MANARRVYIDGQEVQITMMQLTWAASQVKMHIAGIEPADSRLSLETKTGATVKIHDELTGDELTNRLVLQKVSTELRRREKGRRFSASFKAERIDTPEKKIAEAAGALKIGPNAKP